MDDSKVKMIKSFVGPDVPESEIAEALFECDSKVGSAITRILNKRPAPPAPTVKKTVTSTGARISAEGDEENGGKRKRLELEAEEEEKESVKAPKGMDFESDVTTYAVKSENVDKVDVKKEDLEECSLPLEDKTCSENEKLNLDCGKEEKSIVKLEEPMLSNGRRDVVKEEPISLNECRDVVVKLEEPILSNEQRDVVKKEVEEIVCVQPLSSRSIPEDEYRKIGKDRPNPPDMWDFGREKRRAMEKEKEKKRAMEKEDNKVLSTIVIEDGDFPEEQEWFLVGRNVIMGLSTTKGRKLETNEIVNIAFPPGGTWTKGGIVRFSTKRNGEVID